MKLTRTERLLSAIAPRMALRRYHARAALDYAQRAYEAASGPSRLRKQRTDGRSADQVNAPAADAIRYQGRWLEENYDIAKSVLNTMVTGIVGEGIRSYPGMRLRNGALAVEQNRQLQRLWERWGKRPESTQSLSWGGVQQLLCRSWLRDGEVFTRQLLGNVDGIEHQSAVPLTLELLESDYLPIALNDRAADDGVAQGKDPNNRVRQGIEQNEWGAAKAYWFWKRYPTESADGFTGLATTSLRYPSLSNPSLQRVDASGVYHLKLQDRIRQTRGISVFAPVFTRLDDLKDYEQSERIAARIGAAFALAIYKSADSPGLGQDSGVKWREMDLAPGIIADQLQEGEKIESIKNERPSNQISEFRTNQLRSVAGGTGANFSTMSKEYGGNYSSQRQENNESHALYRALRMLFITNGVQPTYEMFVLIVITMRLVEGMEQVDPSTYYDVSHIGSGMPFIDVKKESDADVARISAGLSSREQTIMGRGGDPQATYAQILAEFEADQEAGLVFTTSPTPKAAPGEAQAEPPEDEPTNEPEEDDDDN